MMRSHTCGELRAENIGSEAELAGWVSTRRDHGGIIFIDLRDRYGITQVVFDPQFNPGPVKSAEGLRREDVIVIKGVVKERKPGMENEKIPTGKIEVFANSISIVSRAETPPIEIDDRIELSDDIRLRYRYLDLRRPLMQHNLLMRHRVVTAGREYFNSHGFLEIETPLLVKSTPEGARDYVVPSRVSPGKFYALPQSPQLYKQLLMIAGCDRYYQVARCLRDEDLRADRQPEHTQFDLEMSFVTSDDVRAFVEGLFKHIFKEVQGIVLEDFPVFSYEESMRRFGTDKPDIRYALELNDVTDIAKRTEFSVFKEAESVQCLNPERDFSRKEFDSYIEFCQGLGAKGMAWARVTAQGLESSIAKYISPELQNELIGKAGAKQGTSLMFIAGKRKHALQVAGQLRARLGQDMKLAKPDAFRFCWVKDFPLFSYNEDEGRWEPEHHMFSMPKPEFVSDFEKRPGEVLGDLFDVVMNGTELGSGSIRVSDPMLQERIMAFIGLSKEQAHQKFGFLLDAYRYGGPPHGGMGLGVDRLVALMLGKNDIREVIAFPKNKSAECPMDGSPSEIDSRQMRELHLKHDIVKRT